MREWAGWGMGGYMHGWLGGQMDGWVGEWADGWMDGQMGGCRSGLLGDAWAGGWRGGRMANDSKPRLHENGHHPLGLSLESCSIKAAEMTGLLAKVVSGGSEVPEQEEMGCPRPRPEAASPALLLSRQP